MNLPQRSNRTSTGRRLLNVVAVLLLVAAVVPFVTFAVPQVVGGNHSYVVLTGSMRPTINPGDAVIDAKVNPATLERGDVITFTRPDSKFPTTHRIVAVQQTNDGPAFKTRGDANDGPDPWTVPATDVVGRVMVTIPYLGFVVQFVQSTGGFVALVVLPIVLLVLTEAWDVVRSVRSTDDEMTEDATGDAASSAVEDADSVDTPVAVTTDRTETGGVADEPPTTGGFALSRTDLTLSAGLLGVFAIYSGVVAYLDPTAWAVTVLVAVVTTLLLVVGLRQFGMAPAGSPAPTTETDGGRSMPAGAAGVSTAAAGAPNDDARREVTEHDD